MINRRALSARFKVSAAIAILVVAPATRIIAAAGAADTPPISAIDSDSAYPSLALAEDGLPVLAYSNSLSGSLKVVRCNDPACQGGDESMATVDTAGTFPSLVLDSNGLPVIAYSGGNGDVRVARCNDPACEGGDESISAVDPAGNVGWFPALALDPNGFPVIAYYNATNGGLAAENAALEVVRCNDLACAGGDESIVSVDAAGQVGWWPSLALDQDGFPVIAYYDFGVRNVEANGDLKLVHCNDLACAGDDETLARLDAQGDTGRFPSLTLDILGHPVISYLDFTNGDLKLLRCNDAACGDDDETAVSVDTIGDVGWHSRLMFDTGGVPVITYYGNGELKLLRCNDLACSGNDESIVRLATSPFTSGTYHSAQLDASGAPVIAHVNTEGSLVLVHCSSPVCTASPSNTSPSNQGPTFTTMTTVEGTVQALPETGVTVSATGRTVWLAAALLCAGALLAGVTRRPRAS